jgi:membrane protease subunit HflC
MKRSPLTLAVGLLLLIIFGLMLFVYQVRPSEAAVVTFFGKPSRIKDTPGPGLRLPWPIEKVVMLDERIQNFAVESKFEEIKLSDQSIILLSVYVGYRISNPTNFFTKWQNGSIAAAEGALEGLVRSAKNEVAGRHPLSDFISTDERQMKFSQIEAEILQEVQRRLANLNYGVDMKFIQIKKIGLPESVTQNVFDRMKSERQTFISIIESNALVQSTEMKSAANSKAAIVLSDADAAAKIIRGEGEAQRMKSLEVLQQNPDLAKFILQMEALEQFLRQKTTLVLDLSTSPLQWLKMSESAQTNK